MNTKGRLKSSDFRRVVYLGYHNCKRIYFEFVPLGFDLSKLHVKKYRIVLFIYILFVYLLRKITVMEKEDLPERGLPDYYEYDDAHGFILIGIE